MSGQERRRKWIFAASVALAAAAVLVYNVLTPYMTDDLIYGEKVRQAGTLAAVLAQEKEQYLTWTGRSVSHMILRLFLLGDKWVFQLANSAVFVGLSLLMYANIRGRKPWDWKIFWLLQALLWLFGVEFAQTVLWETGACNYLWGSFLILGFVTLVRRRMQMEGKCGKRAGLWHLVLFLYGIVAGWCNENTSGGAILLTVFLIFLFWRREKKVYRQGVSGLAGLLIGFGFMVLAPGNRVRGQYMEEAHTGIAALASRAMKCTLAIETLFLPLLLLFLLAVCILWYQKQFGRRKECEATNWAVVWFLVFGAVSYALVLTPEPMPRAYFGAGIFLTIGVVQAFAAIRPEDSLTAIGYPVVTGGLLLVLFFTYIESGADLARIYREDRERTAYIEQEKAAGHLEITVPMLRPEFENRYSDAHNSDLSEDPDNWINIAYAQYYGLDSIRAVPREEWTEY